MAQSGKKKRKETICFRRAHETPFVLASNEITQTHSTSVIWSPSGSSTSDLQQCQFFSIHHTLKKETDAPRCSVSPRTGQTLLSFEEERSVRF